MKLLDYFIKNCQTHPDTVFYSDALIDYTFGYVNECASKVYSCLCARGIGAEDVVAVHLPRSGKIPIALIGIMKAGAAFVVLGERSAPQTVSFILEDTAPKLIIDPELYEEMMTCAPKPGYREPSPHDLASIIYSTGSSGFFKGCMHEYGVYDNVVERTHLYTDSADMSGERDSLTFGFYTTSALVLLCYNMVTGEYFDIVPYTVLADPEAFQRRLREHRITEAFLAPGQISRMDFSAGLSLRYIHSIYEMFDGIYLETPTLLNCYGMTESFQALTYFIVDRPYDITPVGAPCYDVTIKIADSDGNGVKNGEIGEVWYLSRFFRGYLNRPDLTAQVLQEGWYHTGDMGKFREDGVLIILGRKIDLRRTPHGWVVPFEIALAAKKVLGLSWAYVKLFGNTTICLYYCDETDLSPAAVRTALRGCLPDYALPTHCMRIEKIPYFPSGKIMRTAFPNPEV